MRSLPSKLNKPTAFSVVWEPKSHTQKALVACPVFEIFFGGARGGGKTESSIGDWLAHSDAYGEGAIGLFVRRKFIQLQEVIARTKQIFPKLGARYNVKDKEWRMPNGARLKFAYLEKDIDAEEYQGHNYTRIYVEEATNFPSSSPIDKLRACLRSAVGVPCGMRLTGNPGGPGHNWVKARYITPNPRGYEVIVEEEIVEVDGKAITVKIDRVFIPSKLADNQMLLRVDPGYIMRLKQSGSAALVKAWLEGNWDIVDGAFFDNWDPEVHVLDKSWLGEIPKDCTKFRAFDWGSAKPFSCGWYAISDGTWGLPKNALFKYKEWYGAKGPNKGLKMTADLVAQGILRRERNEVISYGSADPSIFTRNGGPSIAENMALEGCMWRAADNKRLPGWEQLRLRLSGNYGVPMIYFSEDCVDTIRTIATIQHDDKNLEDLDTETEDHAVDETRYAVMSRPWVPLAKDVVHTPHNANVLELTFNEIVQRRRRARLNGES